MTEVLREGKFNLSCMDLFECKVKQVNPEWELSHIPNATGYFVKNKKNETLLVVPYDLALAICRNEKSLEDTIRKELNL